MENMPMSQPRPIERVITRLHEGGANPSEIGRRVAKQPGTVMRILEMRAIRDGIDSQAEKSTHQLRPIERVVLKLRARGESYGEIGNRLRRSGRFVQRVEQFAQLKMSD
jgi:DNA-binding NarL/FixJ family response regulator